MCIPKQPDAAAPTVPASPSMQAASALSVAAPRGAASLGRLALRFSGSSGAASSGVLGLGSGSSSASPARVPSATTTTVTPSDAPPQWAANNPYGALWLSGGQFPT